MAELKQGRWVKIHEPGEGNIAENENVMDIMIGADRCQAEATYTVRSYKKAAYWLAEYLKYAEALQIIAQDALDQIQAASETASREDPKVTVTGEGWGCEIEKMADGEYRVCMNWTVSEPVIRKGKKVNSKPDAKKDENADSKPDAKKGKKLLSKEK